MVVPWSIRQGPGRKSVVKEKNLLQRLFTKVKGS